MTTHATQDTAHPQPDPSPAQGNEAEAVPLVVVLPDTHRSEKYKERAVVLRVLVYVAVAHFLVFFLWLMFAVIGKS